MFLEMAPQLLAERFQVGRVDVERDFRERRVMHVEKQSDQQIGHAVEIGDDSTISRIVIGSDLGQLEPIERTFADQRLATVVGAAALLTFRILLSYAKGDQG